MLLRPLSKRLRPATVTVLLGTVLLAGCRELPSVPDATGPTGLPGSTAPATNEGLGESDPQSPSPNVTSASPSPSGSESAVEASTPPSSSGGTEVAANVPPVPAAGTKPIPGNAVRIAEFVAECTFSHRLPDDPIVVPGLPGGSHSHDFFGNNVTDAMTNLGDLKGGKTNCAPNVDLSSYWAPTLMAAEKEVPPDSATFYYLGEGVSRDITAEIRPMPVGLKMVAGNAKATSEAESRSRWSCLHAGHVGASKDFVNCPAGTKLETYLDFPQCWDGKNLYRANSAHMAYPQADKCPSSHPIAVPKIRMVLRYPVSGDPAKLRLSSGDGLTMHADFMNAWNEEELSRRVRDCINRIVKCGPDGEY
jgi:hypothetical protein